MSDDPLRPIHSKAIFENMTIDVGVCVDAVWSTRKNDKAIDASTVSAEKWHDFLNEYDFEKKIQSLLPRCIENMGMLLALAIDKDQMPIPASIPSMAVSILLCGNDKIQALNKAYRNKDKPTNVLSFPMFERDEITSILAGKDNHIFTEGDGFLALGDIILSYDVIEAESKAQNKSFEAHVTHLLVHSCLHLLGLDHQEDDEANKMEQIEIDILKDMGITNPYVMIKK